MTTDELRDLVAGMAPVPDLDLDAVREMAPQLSSEVRTKMLSTLQEVGSKCLRLSAALRQDEGMTFKDFLAEMAKTAGALRLEPREIVRGCAAVSRFLHAEPTLVDDNENGLTAVWMHENGEGPAAAVSPAGVFISSELDDVPRMILIGWCIETDRRWFDEEEWVQMDPVGATQQ